MAQAKARKAYVAEKNELNRQRWKRIIERTREAQAEIDRFIRSRRVA